MPKHSVAPPAEDFLWKGWDGSTGKVETEGFKQIATKLDVDRFRRRGRAREHACRIHNLEDDDRNVTGRSVLEKSAFGSNSEPTP